MKFPCNSCGACCRKLGVNVALAKMMDGKDAPPLIKELANFPYTPNADGSCPMLDGNLCSIYKTRPDVCNIQTLWQKYLKGKMTQRQFYKLNKQACKKLGDGLE
jgi:uncharacterized protein